ncbi:hypothetical protein [uncultured Nocardioides sp.]|uniref:Uncharacterized protein n=1 Tax=uncultured Nocardioides sp. TaxID=198441 RepID=A0A6J4N828_9ACTN|nr:hypothetical protein [uncultured Nocardioides sp.]CAA9377512.1 MAG: hypothetical protein AVDCRST_MAG06-671 [uncultured Nocardioides sp.]
MSSRRPLAVALATVSAGAVLSGCAGSASPGVAVDVDGQTISVAEVDRGTAAVCTSVEPDLRGAGNTVALGNVRQFVVTLLAASEQARQLADEYGVKPGPEFSRQVSQLRLTSRAFPEEVREDYVEVMSAEPLVTSVVDAVGRASLEQDGVADPTVEEISQRGQDLFQSWPDQHAIDVDPRYGLAMVDGQLQPADTNLSVAVGDVAKSASATEPDPVYARTLPAGHRCG